MVPTLQEPSTSTAFKEQTSSHAKGSNDYTDTLQGTVLEESKNKTATCSSLKINEMKSTQDTEVIWSDHGEGYANVARRKFVLKTNAVAKPYPYPKPPPYPTFPKPTQNQKAGRTSGRYSMSPDVLPEQKTGYQSMLSKIIFPLIAASRQSMCVDEPFYDDTTAGIDEHHTYAEIDGNHGNAYNTRTPNTIEMSVCHK